VLDKGSLLCMKKDICISFWLFVRYHRLLFLKSEHYLRHNTFEGQHITRSVVPNKAHSELFLPRIYTILVIDSKCQEDELT
jgi:hypothetical protein